MTKNKQLILIALLLLIVSSCKKDDLSGKYARPEWLAGKLYTQILTNPELSTFADLLHVAGYDTIIDVSGSYTVFAPTNAAFATYFQQNQKYKSLADLPQAEAVKLVKYHLVQNPWSKKQLRSLDIYGWIDTLDLRNNLPKGYKRETLLRGKNMKYGVQYSRYKKQNSTLKRTNVIDTTLTSWTRRVFTDSRKFAPVFYKEYFSIYDLSTSDYAFYFGRQFENMNDLYYCNGRITSDEIFAENGFVYSVDQVIQPLRNGMEILSDKSSSSSYTQYLNLVNQFAEMDYNASETNKQPGADQGFKVDSLFNLRYPQLVFDISSEKTVAPKGSYGLPGNVTIRYHQGIVAPTDAALKSLVSQYLEGGNNWGSLEDSPENIKRIVANSSLSINPVYPTDFQKGFLNGESDLIKIDEASIVQKEYGSNCTFIGVNQPIVPRAFSSVTGPVYTRKGFSKVMYAIEKSGLLSALKRKDANYSFFVESDANTSIDSSFIVETFNNIQRFSAITLAPSVLKKGLTDEDLRILLLNHIAVDQPKGLARKEFIRNLAGNFITFNNVTTEVSGTAPSVYGYQGSKKVSQFPRKISSNTDNGTTYEIDNWLRFSVNDLFTTISIQYPKFHYLLKKAGLTQDKLLKYTFMSDNQNYTVFVPNDSIMNLTNTDTMTIPELRSFVLLHFIQGDLIFTDGNRQEGYYETARVDEKSTPYSTVYTSIRIKPGIDKITIPSLTGNMDIVINESAKTNILTARNLSTTGSEAYTNSINNGVIHEIKQVLRYELVDTK
ncbi:MAG: fasciclin domain-containing protein [Prolixibacteraceae bacterium]